MSLAEELVNITTHFYETAPEAITKPIKSSKAEFTSAFQLDKVIKVGDKLPSFSLSNAIGKIVTSEELLQKGALLITFYRGEWCPYCNLALHHLQTHLDKFQACGVTLVAISPELPDQALTTTEKNELQFPVLSDVGNAFAKRLGIVFKQPNTMKPVFDAVGVDLKKRNGDESLEVPVPATLLVGENGIVKNRFVEPDYTKRVDGNEVLKWIDAMNA